jgi:hypothetical protein
LSASQSINSLLIKKNVSGLGILLGIRLGKTEEILN